MSSTDSGNVNSEQIISEPLSKDKLCGSNSKTSKVPRVVLSMRIMRSYLNFEKIILGNKLKMSLA
jgi:hypothetical protein